MGKLALGLKIEFSSKRLERHDRQGKGDKIPVLYST